MKTLLHKDREPRCGWCYDVPETGFCVRQGSWRNLTIKVRAHYKANGIEFPSNLDALIDDQICSKIPDKFWESDDGERGGQFWSDSEMMKRQMTLSREMNRNHTPEFIADEALAKSRMHICIGCSLNVNPFGCFTCSDHYKRVAGWRFQRFNTPPKLQGSDTYAYECWGTGIVILLLIHATAQSILPVARKIPFDRLPDHCWLRKIQPEEDS